MSVLGLPVDSSRDTMTSSQVCVHYLVADARLGVNTLQIVEADETVRAQRPD